MTTANKITILRIMLVPFFVVELLYFLRTGQEWHRVAALVAFSLAAALDGVDGYIARHFNQKASWEPFWTHLRTNCCWFPGWWC